MSRGSVVPRPTNDGKMRYRIKWESRGPDGKRKHHSATRSTKKAAEALLAEKLDEVEKGTFVQPTKETVAEFLERWFAASQPEWSDATAYQYRSAIKKRLLPHLGEVPLAQLDELTIQGCYAQLIASGYAPKTVVGTHAILDAALTRAVAWKILPRNPADGVKAPSAPTAAPATWSREEAEAFLAHTDGDRFGVLWRLGLDSGMRIGEMLAMTWRDLDLERGAVAIRRTLTRTRGGGWKIGEIAKTTSSRRSIQLGATTIAKLRTLRVPQNERRLVCGGAWHDLDLIFDRGDGLYLAPVTVSRCFERAVRAAEVSNLTPHGMRHTMATLLLAAGVHPKIVQDRLGHKTVQMTLDRYSHVSMNMQHDAADLLDALLSGSARPRRGQEVV